MSNSLCDAHSSFEDGIAYCEAIVMHVVLHDLGNQRIFHGPFMNDSGGEERVKAVGLQLFTQSSLISLPSFLHFLVEGFGGGGGGGWYVKL